MAVDTAYQTGAAVYARPPKLLEFLMPDTHAGFHRALALQPPVIPSEVACPLCGSVWGWASHPAVNIDHNGSCLVCCEETRGDVVAGISMIKQERQSIAEAAFAQPRAAPPKPTILEYAKLLRGIWWDIKWRTKFKYRMWRGYTDGY